MTNPTCYQIDSDKSYAAAQEHCEELSANPIEPKSMQDITLIEQEFSSQVNG